jgi:hypothetical protein
VLPANGNWSVKNGDKMIWKPGTKGIRAMFPEDNRHEAAIVDQRCRVFGIDTSLPAKDIKGI